ncbi:Uncharacterized protein QTN25_002004 [Entamoeba marina]
MKTKATTLNDLYPRLIYLNTLNKECKEMFHSIEVDSTLDEESVRKTCQQFEKEVEQIMLRTFTPQQRLFKPKRMLVDRYGETHRQALLALFNDYNPVYFNYLQNPLGDQKKLHDIVFKGYDYTEKSCLDVVMFVIQYIMVLDMMRTHKILGNVRLFKNTTDIVSSIDILKQLQYRVFDTQKSVYITLKANGYKLEEKQFPQFCKLYHANSVNEFMNTGVELSVLATYLASTRLHDARDILHGLVEEPNQKQAIKNLNIIVGFLHNFGVPNVVDGVRLYDYLLFKQQPLVVETFIYQFLRALHCIISISPHVIINEISRITRSTASLKSTDNMYLAWAHIIGQQYGKLFKISEYEYFLPYLYIVSFYAGLPIHRTSITTDINKNRIAIINAMKEALIKLNIPLTLFNEKCSNGSDEHFINHILSFLFYHIQRNGLVDYSITVIQRSVGSYLSNKRLMFNRKFISSLFHTITISKGAAYSHNFNFIVDSTRLIQSSLPKFIFDTNIQSICSIQSYMKQIICTNEMYSITKSLIDVQSAMRSFINYQTYNSFTSVIMSTQTNYKQYISYYMYRLMNNSLINSQSILRNFYCENGFNSIYNETKSVSNQMRSFFINYSMNQVENVTIQTQALSKSIYSLERFRDILKHSKNVQSIGKRNIVSSKYDSIIKSVIETQALFRCFSSYNKNELFIKSSINTACVMKEMIHYSKFKTFYNKIPTIQSITRSFVESLFIKNHVINSQQIQSLFCCLNQKTTYSNLELNCCLNQLLCRTFYTTNSYRNIISFQQQTSSIIRCILIKKEFNTITCEIPTIQTNAKSKQYHKYLLDIVGATRSVQEIIKAHLNKKQFDLIDVLSHQITATCRTKSTAFAYLLQRAAIINIQSVLNRNNVFNTYQNIVTKTSSTQPICKSLILTNNKNAIKTALRVIQQHSKYRLVMIHSSISQSFCRKANLINMKTITYAQHDCETIIRSRFQFRKYDTTRSSIIKKQALLRQYYQKQIYSNEVSSSCNIQAIIRRNLLFTNQNQQCESTIKTQSVIRQLLVEVNNKNELEEHYKKCEYLRYLKEYCITTQSLCREVIVKYGADLDDEVLKPLSFSFELCSIPDVKTQKYITKAKRQKRDESPSRRNLPKEVVMNALILNKSTCFSPDKTKLLEYLRNSRRSVIDLAFSNIKMIQRRKLDEIQIGFKQLMEQVKCSEWFRMMFMKYECVGHILGILKVSNKSPPFIELVESSCSMLHLLVYHKSTFQIFQRSDLVQPTIAKVSEIIRNFMEIKVLCSATKLLIILAQNIPGCVDSMKDVCIRLNSKLNEIETKEKIELKHLEAVAAKTKKEVCFEKASPHIRKLINIVTSTK